MSIKSANQQGHFRIIFLFIIVLVFASAGLYVYFARPFSGIASLKTQTKPYSSESALKTSAVEIDTTDWQAYPTAGSFTGWSIRHPAKYKPLGVQAEHRVYIESMENESVMISIRNNSFSEGTFRDYAEYRRSSDFCTAVSELMDTGAGGNAAYVFKSTCEDSNLTTYVFLNPYLQKETVEVRLYTQYAANDEQVSLGKKIIETFSFVKPEESVEKGYNAFYNVTLGFSLKYPEKYVNETDSATGWKNTTLVLYSGGQSYDLIVQVWDSEDAYKKEFADNPAALDNITVKKVKGKYVTFLNMNDSKEVEGIIGTFELEAD
jgi:hypothetical protein